LDVLPKQQGHTQFLGERIIFLSKKILFHSKKNKLLGMKLELWRLIANKST